ncbi:hypothetical protein [Streptococcus sanguinis]|uniref:Uncharacterized protein n=1 Tax=Streptococcus sanguinis TaxID=1305 RepID=A0A2X3V5H2_STRSA|nr:hypothetical protein [Streptococcus sanguinis]EGJ41285.1 hypothetical protein HMPREF9396_2299 [Streptococcus sanguinis SK1059]EGQ18246.1 hypothetical protein HMPREF8573_2287 [Streptococcus sanguinis ATCC 29667]EGQ25887.1 hypothetical protein HMPREF9387_0118 [Streptococcus sanguinis SK340]SQF36534.1 Uncharacterised protein [Streptococcus sanguinis]
MKWIKNKWVITSLLLISIFSAIIIYNNLTAKKDEVKYDDYSTKVDKILLFGDKQQYVVGLDKEGRETGARPTQNYLVYQERRMQERLGNNNHQLEGDYWYLILHDLRTKDFKKRKIDLYKELYRYDHKLQPWGYDPVYYNGKDYVAVLVSLKEEPDSRNGRYLFWDIEAEKFQEAPRDFDAKTYSEELGMRFMYTNLSDAMTPYHSGIISWTLSFSKLDSEEKLPKTANINLYQECPEMVKLVQEEKISRVYLRKGQNTKESVFEDLRHLFAPIGQDKIDVIATDPKTGEQTPINSYQEMEAWWSQHSAIGKK